MTRENGREAKGVPECQNAQAHRPRRVARFPQGFRSSSGLGESQEDIGFFLFLAKTCKGAGVPEPWVLERGVGREVCLRRRSQRRVFGSFTEEKTDPCTWVTRIWRRVR
jgi:hypothetical protein